MALPKYNPQQREKIAQQAGIGEQYLYQILNKFKTAPPLLARKLNSIDKKIKLKDLRPNDWRVLWPELACNSSRNLEKSKADR